MAEKFIKSKEELEYKKQLRAFMAVINPHPTAEEIEKLKQEYIAKRGVK